MDARKLAKKKEKDLRKPIQIPLTSEEKELMLELARKEKLPLATFIRWKLLKDA